MLAVKVLEEILSLVSLRKRVSKVDSTHSRQIIKLAGLSLKEITKEAVRS
ncbi:hypothetical protein QNH42_14690 [Cytobacillus firmus]|nr:hypothetical protein [Cytobacillus firmus]WHY59836.1 hypothetical protein QNH42_14690 [Cytobacillus firmus]